MIDPDMPKQQPNQTPPKNFEKAVEELEQILGQIESGELGLEETLVKYERGNFLIQHCREVLNAAEKQIEVISKGPEGTLVSQPFESTAAPEGQSA
jgi:exodeoxyribonuclease VII small subunit